MAIPYTLSRTHFYQWWLRLWYVSARTPKFRPLLRAEFANNDQFAQADFLCRAGYYNAAVCMSRFAVEKRLRRLALITPRWKEFRSPSTGKMVSFLYSAEVLNRKTVKQCDRFFSRANKAVHETVIDKHRAFKILREGEQLRPLLDAATSTVLSK